LRRLLAAGFIAMASDHPPGSIDPVRRLLSDCATIAFCDPAGVAGPLRSLLADHYRLLPVDALSDPAVAGADLLVVASAPLPSPGAAVWPPTVWLQPGVTLHGIPSAVTVIAGDDLRRAFTDRFLSSCSG
jgi:hypothetical protein